MNQTDAIKILIKATQIAQKKGAYNLSEASIIHEAISCFIDTKQDYNELMYEKSINREDETIIDNN